MKTIIVLIALLVATLAQASPEVDRIIASANNRIIQMSLSSCSYQTNSSDSDSAKCEAELNGYVNDAVGGNDAVYDSLIEFIGDKQSGSFSQRTYANKCKLKLEMAQQRALLKAKQGEAK